MCVVKPKKHYPQLYVFSMSSLSISFRMFSNKNRPGDAEAATFRAIERQWRQHWDANQCHVEAPAFFVAGGNYFWPFKHHRHIFVGSQILHFETIKQTIS